MKVKCTMKIIFNSVFVFKKFMRDAIKYSPQKNNI